MTTRLNGEDILFAWQCYRNEQWGIISGVRLEKAGPMTKLPFITRLPEEALDMRDLAIKHGQDHQCPVRLVLYRGEQVLEDVRP